MPFHHVTAGLLYKGNYLNRSLSAGSDSEQLANISVEELDGKELPGGSLPTFLKPFWIMGNLPGVVTVGKPFCILSILECVSLAVRSKYGVMGQSSEINFCLNDFVVWDGPCGLKRIYDERGCLGY